MIAGALVAYALLLLFPLPAAALLAARDRPRSLGAAIDRLAGGYAVSWCALYVVSAWSFRLFVPLWLAALVAAVVVVRRGASPLPARPAARATRRLLAAVLGAAFLLRTLPALLREFPLGWDPYFHLVVADRIAVLHTLVRDLRPYESIALNYPIGSHLLLAFVADLGGVPVHQVFNFAIVWFGALTCAQVFALATAALGDEEAGVYAAAAYGLLAVLGSLGYYVWGGLPNLIGMYLLLALLSHLAAEESAPPPRAGAWVGALRFAALFLAICLVHHHVMLTATLGLLVTAGWAWRSGRSPALARTIARGLAASAVLGAPYFLAYLTRAARLDRTGIGDFAEPLTGLAVDLNDMGLVFAFAAVAGLVLAWSGRGARPAADVVAPPLVAMLLAWVVFKYGTRMAILALTGRTVSLFTPSRFLTDAVPLLAVFAGLFFLEMRRLAGTTPGRTLAALAVGFLLSLPAYARLFRDDVPASSRAAYAWIREHAEADAGVVETQIHGAYLTRRPAAELPLPISEYVRDARNQRTLRAIGAGLQPASDFGRVYVIARGSEFARLRGRVVWHDPDSGVRILILD